MGYYPNLEKREKPFWGSDYKLMPSKLGYLSKRVNYVGGWWGGKRTTYKSPGWENWDWVFMNSNSIWLD